MVDDKMVTHFVCRGGCGGVAPDAGSCQVSTCPNFNKPLEPCGCTDGAHGAATSAESQKPSAPETPQTA